MENDGFRFPAITRLQKLYFSIIKIDISRGIKKEKRKDQNYNLRDFCSQILTTTAQSSLSYANNSPRRGWITMTNRAFQSFAPCFRASLLRVHEEAKCVTRWSKGCARVRAERSKPWWCHGTLDFSPFTFWLLHCRGIAPEGETNRRSCAVHADNYLRSPPPYCFLNNRLPITRLLAWCASFFRARGSSYAAAFPRGCVRTRGYRFVSQQD